MINNKKSRIIFSFFYALWGGPPPHPWDFTALHNDPVPQHSERCKIRAQDRCPQQSGVLVYNQHGYIHTVQYMKLFIIGWTLTTDHMWTVCVCSYIRVRIYGKNPHLIILVGAELCQSVIKLFVKNTRKKDFEICSKLFLVRQFKYIFYKNNSNELVYWRSPRGIDA